VDVRDAGGNRTLASTVVVVDRTASFLRWSRAFYPQDGDALLPTSQLGYRLARDAKTTLRLYDAAGRLVRTVWSVARRATAGGTGPGAGGWRMAGSRRKACTRRG
jgi:hypothetical protein